MSERRCTILGGLRDGEIVGFCGQRLLMPVPLGFGYALTRESFDVLPTEAGITVDEYVLRRDDDGRFWYVREPRP